MSDKTATVSFVDGVDDDIMAASKFDVGDGWITLIDAAGDVVAAYPEDRVNSIKFR